MDLRGWGVLLAGVACFSSFVWAIRFHFHRPGTDRLGIQVLSVINVVAFAWFLYGLSTETGGYRLIPLGLCALSLSLFWWCVSHTRRKRFTLAFSSDAPTFLDTEGPYRVARHPFYLSYLMFWLAMALAVPGAPSWVALMTMAALYTFAAAKEEAKFANSVLDREYRIYRMHTGMFCPLLIRQRRKEYQA